MFDSLLPGQFATLADRRDRPLGFSVVITSIAETRKTTSLPLCRLVEGSSYRDVFATSFNYFTINAFDDTSYVVARSDKPVRTATVSLIGSRGNARRCAKNHRNTRWGFDETFANYFVASPFTGYAKKLGIGRQLARAIQHIEPLP
jgi:hypothetical protein